jgi:hypothetical protein
MSYRSESIAMAINRMNRQYFLPAIQREFVWKPDQIVELFDSIMRRYPISSFLFWELKPENRDKWQAYKFLENARHGGTHNELASTAGISTLTMVLDGQQRLTSLLIGLRGTYSMKRKYGRWDSPDAWSKQRLHLDLLADPHLDGDGAETSIYYKFAFLEKTPPPDSDHYWFPVSGILDFSERQSFETFLEERDEELDSRNFTRADRRIFERNLARLYEVIHVDEVIAYYTETDQDYDRVLDIFVRANEGGTKLSKSDLLLSMVTSKWDGMNARDEIFAFVDAVNTQLTRQNDFDKDFIMKSCLVLTDLPVVYKVQNFNNDNLELIRREWGAIKSAVKRGVDLVNSFGIDRDNLTSVNAIIPIIYFLLKNPTATLRGTTQFDVRNADCIRRWLIMVLLKGAFGRASDGLLAGIRSKIQVLQNPGAHFPLDEINATIGSTGLNMVFDEYAVEEFLGKTYGGKQTFLALSLLYDDASWGTIAYHQDHLFASSLFRPKELPMDRLDWLRQKDRLGNLCLLMSSENIGKQDMAIDDWLATRDASFLKRHLIPEDKSLWKFERFPDFLAAREKLISDRLRSIFQDQGSH